MPGRRYNFASPCLAGFLWFLAVAWGQAPLHAQAAPPPAQPDLEKEFYNDYLDSLPDERATSRVILERNLLSTLKRVIVREDPFEGESYTESLTVAQLSYKKVTLDSPFIRGLFRELPYLQKTEYMWLVRTGPYMVFITYRADPERFVLTEHQNKVVKKNTGAPKEPNHTNP